MAEAGRSEVDIDERIIVAWINSFKKVPRVTNLDNDLQDGLILCKLIDELGGQVLATKKVIKRPEGQKQKHANITLALECAKVLSFFLSSLSLLNFARGKDNDEGEEELT